MPETAADPPSVEASRAAPAAAPGVPPEAAQVPHGLRALLAQRTFVRYLVARLASAVALQMQTVAVGAQVYALIIYRSFQ